MLRTDGTVWSFGANLYGGLGQGTTGLSAPPAPVVGLTDVVRISAGEFQSMAIKADGSLWVWGRNAQGQLGIGSSADIALPVQLTALPFVADVSTGVFLSMAVDGTGTIWTWGDGTSGGLGNGDNSSSTVPLLVTTACSVLTTTPENDAPDALMLAPNPTSGRLWLQSSISAPLPISVSDIHGRTLHSTTLANEQRAIDLSPYDAGIYFVSVRTPLGVRVLRVIVE